MGHLLVLRYPARCLLVDDAVPRTHTLVPLLQGLKELKASPATSTPPPRKGKAASAPVAVDLGGLPPQVEEALDILRQLKEMADSGALAAQKSYRPWAPKPVGTRIDEEGCGSAVLLRVCLAGA